MQTKYVPCIHSVRMYIMFYAVEKLLGKLITIHTGISLYIHDTIPIMCGAFHKLWFATFALCICMRNGTGT